MVNATKQSSSSSLTTPRTGPQTPPWSSSIEDGKVYGDDEINEDQVYDDAPIHQGLLNKKRKRIWKRLAKADGRNSGDWMRPYWLGTGLFLLLFAFWLLDSLKDPIFARLTQGNLNRHQPPAKIWSVVFTLVLVCSMEYLANLRRRQSEVVRTQEEVLDPGGSWTRMSVAERHHRARATTKALDDTVSVSIFFQIGIPYAVAFFGIAYAVMRFREIEPVRNGGATFERSVVNEGEGGGPDSSLSTSFDVWYVLAYVLYATIESFGSIAVATFWSYANSTLTLADAERYYGPVIAIAQIGAIGGSTMVASDRWEPPTLLVTVSLIIMLHILLMWRYHQRFPPTNELVAEVGVGDDAATILTWQDDDATETKPFWSGLYLIFRHNYVLLILGVSCLYEVSLTCLDYQMKLLGWERFNLGEDHDNGFVGATGGSNGKYDDMTFSQFMGRYGQVVNLVSLLFSSILFPIMIRKFGLRITLRVFPTLLLAVTLVTYVVLPGNLAVIFVSMSLLKAMTYSVHDPAKEILYNPTSNAVKFRAKFWIDVVGERISKAIGSAFNNFAGSVDRSVQLGGLPSLLSSAGLWVVCFYAGNQFDRLVSSGRVVGLDQSMDPSTYRKVDVSGIDDNDATSRQPEWEIEFSKDNASNAIDVEVDDSSLLSFSESTDAVEMPPVQKRLF